VKLVGRNLLGHNADISVAAARILIMTAPLVHPSIFTEEGTREKLVAFVKDSTPIQQTYATGVLAMALTERDLADTIVRTGLASTLLARLRKLVDSVHAESDTEQGKNNNNNNPPERLRSQQI